MKLQVRAPLLALATVTALVLGGSQFAIYGADEGKQPMLSHDVFFASSKTARKRGHS